ncbi:type II toxin-antitoxin system RelE/ParE family toxin [Sedimentisphaera salicampi]|uniref:Phage-related protein n=1 Tax=Sedimentisphaera salicampi TaxID=1941349 RepID=A0A1W6LP87_9BACT|nr:type II toxin-antitoxin system RelE/ParE family toxin [Sedimentisphaera salicampi]ARN57605.1 Phage-related protein [Sedimentisphaera salicampi]
MDSGKNIKVRFYRSPSGNEPVRDWLKSLLPEEKLKMGTDIKTVEFGWPIGLPVCRSLGEGLWEVRSNFQNRIGRVIFYIKDDTMWLLHGFIKKQQKTPASDLDTAKKRKREIQIAIWKGR